LAWTNELGFGWSRNTVTPSKRYFAAQGQTVELFDASSAVATVETRYPRTPGSTQISLWNKAAGNIDYNFLSLSQNADGSSTITANKAGSAVAKPLTLNAPAGVQFPDGTAAAPGITFASEPGMGWYRIGAGTIATAVGGGLVSYLGAGGPTLTNYILFPRAAGGTSILELRNSPAAADIPVVHFKQMPDGSAMIQTNGYGTYTRGNLSLDAPQIYARGTTNILPPAGSAVLTLGKSAAGNASDIYSYLNSLPRWGVRLGAGNTTDDFFITRYDDSGAYVDAPFSINRSTGVCYVNKELVAYGAITCTKSGSQAVNLANGGIYVHPQWGMSLPGWYDQSPFFTCAIANGSPNWNNCWFRMIHSSGYWAGIDMGTNAAGNAAIQFVLSSGSAWGTINAAAFSVQSDERGKKFVAPLEAHHAAFMGIRPIHWEWPILESKEGDAPAYPDYREKWGFSAQNLTTHVPLAVNGNVEAIDINGKPVTASIDPVPIIALTVLEVQALWNEIKSLKAEIAALKAK
jgi:hypothetical protein